MTTDTDHASHPQPDTAPAPLARPQPPRPIPQDTSSHLSAIIHDVNFHPIPQDPSSCFEAIVRAVNHFSKLERQHPYSSSDELYTALKLHLHTHYHQSRKLTTTRSHRRTHNIYRSINHATERVTKITAKLRRRAAAQDAVATATFATQSASINAISRRIERAFNPNKASVNIEDAPADQAAQHARFWPARWGQ